MVLRDQKLISIKSGSFTNTLADKASTHIFYHIEILG